MLSFLKQATTVVVTPVALLILATEAVCAATFRLVEATISDINSAIDAGALSSEQLVELYLNRIAAYDNQGPSINAIREINPNALTYARALDQERLTQGRRSPLHGIPILLKDNFDTFDLPTTGGSDALAGSIPPDDAFVVQRLRDAGAIILGKSELDEFAISGSGYSSLGGQTLNPYQLNRQSAGSSGGTGAAIASSFATVGTGTDTGGSIRTPSSFQALVGIRPTRGLISLDGIIPFALSRDGAGPMARTVTDAALTLGVMAGFDPNNPSFATPVPEPTVQPDKFFTDYTQFLKPDALNGARLGVVRNYFGNGINGVDPEVNQIVENSLTQLRSLGATTVDITFENTFLQTMAAASSTIARAEQKPYLDEYLETLSPEYPKTVEEIITILQSPEVVNSPTPSTIVGTLNNTVAFGGLTNPQYLDVANNVIPSLRSTVLSVFDNNDLDAFVFPTIGTFARPLPGTTDLTFVSPPGAPPIRQVEFASLLGFADVTVPAGFGSQNLPVTLSITGRPYSESTLLGFAYAFEQATKVRRPPSLLPDLPGEVFEYQAVPEPSMIPAGILAGLGFAGVKLIRRRQQRSIVFSPSLAAPKSSSRECVDEGVNGEMGS
ncbi:MAG: amidase [Oscillatoriales cyanobacterium C42_A2020_001]|nr:amidase [Leptolyngbyaceae cyanobacterium C42_A2020_001]